jgi:hypothetical protein
MPMLNPLEIQQSQGPLTTFQNTKFEKADFKKLVKSINNSGGDNKLDEAVLDEVFEMWWGKLESQINGILESHQNNDEVEHRSERDILEEVLELTRLGARKRSRSLELHPALLMDLAENSMRLQHIVEQEGSKRAYMALRSLQKPIEHLIRRSDHPEVYRNYRMMRSEMQHRMILDEEDSDSES